MWQIDSGLKTQVAYIIITNVIMFPGNIPVWIGLKKVRYITWLQSSEK